MPVGHVSPSLGKECTSSASGPTVGLPLAPWLLQAHACLWWGQGLWGGGGGPLSPHCAAYRPSEAGLGQVSDAHVFAWGSWPEVSSSLHLLSALGFPGVGARAWSGLSLLIWRLGPPLGLIWSPVLSTASSQTDGLLEPCPMDLDCHPCRGLHFPNFPLLTPLLLVCHSWPLPGAVPGRRLLHSDLCLRVVAWRSTGISGECLPGRKRKVLEA